MNETTSPLATKGEPLVVNNWPMNLEVTRQEFKKAQKRLERYQAALRLAGVEIERRNRGLIALTAFTYQTSRATSSSTLLKLALVQALETIAAPVGAIVLIDPYSKTLSMGVHKGLAPELHDIVTGRQLEAGATALMPHLVTGSGALLEYDTTDDQTERLLLMSSHLTSLVSLPLQLGSRLIGAFLVGLQGKQTFTPTDLYFLMTLSQATTIALAGLRLREGLWNTAETFLGQETNTIDLQQTDRADLSVETSTPFKLPETSPHVPQPAEDDLEQLLAAMMEAEDEVQQQNADLQTLNSIGEMMIKTLNLVDILQYTVDQARATLGADAAWLYLLNEKNELEMQAHIGLSSNYVIGMSHLQLGDGLEGQVAVENRAYFVEAIAEDIRNYKIWVDKEKLHALAAVPISRPEIDEQGERSYAQVIGVLVIGKRAGQTHSWPPREIRLLTSIANQVALPIDNARLHAQVRDDQIGLRAGNQVLREINDMLLEKNVFLEGFIYDDLASNLVIASEALQQLQNENSSPLTDTQKQNMDVLQNVIKHLSKLTKETGGMSKALDTEFDKTLNSKDRQNEYTRSTKPIRLKKKQKDEPKSAPNKADSSLEPLPGKPNRNKDTKSKPTIAVENNSTVSKAMSYEEAVAAGLVPVHILGRETT